MTNATDEAGCKARSWRLSAYGGVVLAVLFMLVGNAGIVSAAIGGVVGFVVLGFVLTRFLCPEGQQEMTSAAPAPAPEPVAGPVVEAAPEPASEPEPVAEPEATPEPEPVAATEAAPNPTPVSASSLVKPSKELPGQIELANRKGSWTYKGNASA
ncbi:hypothetical protein J7426_08300 [Tropicibacter sp. R16_0]|uniref:hypothetical protein n=1 Tax=Tropicibacter sp. R16_0 TaxID=2821102 RepID=UPI001AD9C046|nr:hypothetical protein [Tropicibacter sp. R16_0]MBO9450250.1 hypothetical protein [Tropicibacter sp. R16_0]